MFKFFFVFFQMARRLDRVPGLELGQFVDWSEFLIARLVSSRSGLGLWTTKSKPSKDRLLAGWASSGPKQARSAQTNLRPSPARWLSLPVPGIYYDPSISASFIQPLPIPSRMCMSLPMSHRAYNPIAYQLMTLHLYSLIHTTQHDLVMTCMR